MASTTLATTSIARAILLATATLLVAVAMAQAPGPGPAPAAAAPGPETSTTAGAPGPSGGLDCMSYLVNMSDCLTFVEEGSNLTAPEKGCCPELAGLVESQPICLCQLLGSNSSDTLGIQIDYSKALKLPSICAVQTPPVSLCSAAGYPVGVPMPSEAPSPTGGVTPEAGTTPKSGASGIANVVSLQLLGFAIAYCLTAVLVF